MSGRAHLPGAVLEGDAVSAKSERSTRRLEGRRIVFVLNWAVLGGANRQALLLARHLAEAEGATVEVCALTNEEGRASALFRAGGIPWRGLGVRWPGGRLAKAKSLFSLAAALRRLRPDVLMPYCAFPNIVCGLVWRWTGASLCVWHQRDVLPAGLSDRLRQRAVRNTPLFVSNSQHGAEFLVREWGAERARVQVIHNGVDLGVPQVDRAAWRSRLGVGEDDFLVCTLGHLHENKDHGTLLHAWRTVADRLEERGRRAVLLLAGLPYGCQDALKVLAFDLDLGRSVRFLGDVADVAGLVAAVDAGVLSSRSEGCPNALLECMAAGVAVAGTDIAGIREAVGPDGYGLLARPGDADGLAAAIVRIAEDPELRETLGKRNRERVRTVFAVTASIEQHVALLTEGLAAASARRERAAAGGQGLASTPERS